MQRDDVLENELSKLGGFVVSIEDFRIDHVIGRGGFGEVHHAIHLFSGTQCAVKRLSLETLKGAEFKMFIREVKTLVQCRNQFILPLLGFTDTQPYTIITEYMPKGNLQAALRSKKSRLTPTQLTLIAFGVADGMRVLHENEIIHRDLKSENVLLDENMLPKICDFGVARFKTANDQVLTKTIGTLNWMAPEVFASPSYTNKVDVYSYGLLLWSLVTKDVPWYGLDRGAIVEKVLKEQRRPYLPSDTPKALKTLIERCWHEDPKERPSFARICEVFRDGKVFYSGTNKDEFRAGLELIDRLKSAEAVNPLTRKRSSSIDEMGMNLSLSIAPPSQPERTQSIPMPLPESVPKLDRNMAPPSPCDASAVFDMFPDLRGRDRPDIPTFQNPQLLQFMLLYLFEDETLVPTFVEKGLLTCLDFHIPESFHIVERVLKVSSDFCPAIDWEQMFCDDNVPVEPVLSVFSLLADLLVNASEGPFYLLYDHFQYLIDLGHLESLLRILLELRVKDETNHRIVDLILESCLYTNDMDQLDMTVRALTTLDDLDFIGSEIIAYHLATHNEDGKIFGLCLRRAPDPSLIKHLKPVLAVSDAARALLLEIATTKDGGIALMSDMFWLDSPDSLLLLLALAQIPECAQQMRENVETGTRLLDVMRSNPTNEVMEAIAYILSLCHVDHNLAPVVCLPEFITRFVEWTLTVTNTIVLDIALSVVVEMTQVLFLDVVVDLTPRIVELWDVLDKETSLKFLALVMVNSHTRQAIVDSGFLETVQSDTSIDPKLEPLRSSVIALLENP